MLVKSQCFSPIGVNSNLLVNINMKENQLTQLKNEIVSKSPLYSTSCQYFSFNQRLYFSGFSRLLVNNFFVQVLSPF